MMKKATYLQPTIKVVAFKVEEGYNASRLGADNLFSDRLFKNDTYATGERFSEYTDGDGNFFSGRWE